MKKVLALLISFLMVLSLFASCGEQTSTQTSSTDETSASNTEQTQEKLRQFH